MYMKDWIQKLDDFLKLSGKELLNHAGWVSAEVAKLKANEEYDKFHERTQYQPSPANSSEEPKLRHCAPPPTPTKILPLRPGNQTKEK